MTMYRIVKLSGRVYAYEVPFINTSKERDARDSFLDEGTPVTYVNELEHYADAENIDVESITLVTEE